MKISGKLAKHGKPFILGLGFLLAGLVGVLDFATGYELSFSVFYIVPIAVVTWYAGRDSGIGMSLVSALIWFAADFATGHFYTHPLIPVWNSIIRFLFFIIVTLLFSKVRKAVRRESKLARIDYLTGAVNSRFFYELAQMEIDRLKRYRRPFTLAYIDLDNFKVVNDRYGHSVGNEVLRAVVVSVRNSIRRTDVIARLGGDEFALLLPETELESARVSLIKIRSNLLDAMTKKGWPVTFSIGSLTCTLAPVSVDELLQMADELMYSVKRGGKNALNCSVFGG